MLVTSEIQLQAKSVMRRLGPTLHNVLAKKYGNGSNCFCRKLFLKREAWLPKVKAAICMVIIALYIMM